MSRVPFWNPIFNVERSHTVSDEFHSLNGLGGEFIIFIPVVMKSNIFTIYINEIIYMRQLNNIIIFTNISSYCSDSKNLVI